MATAQDQVKSLNDAFDQVDTASTAIGTATAAIAARIQVLLGQIAAAATPEQLQPLVDKATAEVAKFAPLVESLNALGTDPGNPVPVPVPTT